MRAWATAGLLAIGGCFSDNGGGASNAEAATSDASTGAASTGSPPTTGPQTDTMTSTTSDATSGSTGEPPTSESTGSAEGLPCDPYGADCPDGFKCAAYASDGGDAWDANKCVPVTGNDEPGQGCTVEGSGTSGYDSCVEGAMCTNVGENMTGICTSLCKGTASDPTCSPGLVCLVSNAGALNLCVQACDPLKADPCVIAEQVCVENEGTFLCIEGGGYGLGAACEFLNDCDEGLFCGPSDAMYCKAPGGCCLQYCLLGDMNCPGDEPCTPLDPPSSEYPDLGYCGQNL